MKLISIVLLLVIVSVAYSHLVKGCNKESVCNVCQLNIYNLKFKKTVNCGAVHCRTTCVKVLKLWKQPKSAFDAFQKDTVGKCDACFRAGFCSAKICQNQKRREEQVITQAVNRGEVASKYGNNQKEMDSMIGKILNNEKVQFNKVEERVRKEVRKAINPKAKNFFEKNRVELAKSLEEAV